MISQRRELLDIVLCDLDAVVGDVDDLFAQLSQTVYHLWRTGDCIGPPVEDTVAVAKDCVKRREE